MLYPLQFKFFLCASFCCWTLFSHFREVAEPAITVHNLSAETTEAQIMRMFDAYKPVRVEFTSTPIGVEALVVLGGPGDVELSTIAFNRWSRSLLYTQYCVVV